MKIYRPVSTNKITQGWGTQGAWYRENGINVDGHTGIDFACWRGEPVYHSATFDGEARTEVDRKGGIGVRVINKETGESVLYWHLLKPVVADGEEVRFARLIGYGDSTGFSTGNHVHFGEKEVSSSGATKNRDNGYYGAINPTDHFENTFVLDTLGGSIPDDIPTINSLQKRVIQLANITIGLLEKLIRSKKI